MPTALKYHIFEPEEELGVTFYVEGDCLAVTVEDEDTYHNMRLQPSEARSLLTALTDFCTKLPNQDAEE